MTSNGKQLTVTHEILTTVARDQRWPDVVVLLLFCFAITNHLMAGPLGNSEFRFPRILMFPERKSRETLRFEGNKFTVPLGASH